MPLYEHVYLARQDVTAQQVEALTEQYKAVIEQMGGKIAKAEYWGVKSLSYRIRKNRKAHMTLLNVEAPGAALTEVERQMRLNEDILRYLTVRVDEHEEGPSAMMRKSDRDRTATTGAANAGSVVRAVKAAARARMPMKFRRRRGVTRHELYPEPRSGPEPVAPAVLPPP